MTKVKEDLPLDRVRPPPTDDSATKPVWQREPGEAVDMFVDDGWWQVRRCAVWWVLSCPQGSDALQCKEGN